MGVTQAEFRKAMGSFATGVTVITVDYEGEVHGMTANAFASVSLDPLLVLVCVDHATRTHAHLHAKKRFGINVLSEDQRALLRAVLNRIVPARDEMPGAGDLGVGESVERSMAGSIATSARITRSITCLRTSARRQPA